MTETIEIDGLNELMDALRRAPDLVLPHAKVAMQLSLEAIEGRVAEYPPASEANRPGRVDADGDPVGYYDRGVGWFYPVKQKTTFVAGLAEGERTTKARGRVRARKAQREQGVYGYKLSRSNRSQRLRTRWVSQVVNIEGGIEGHLGNSASYMQVVNGMEQARIHTQRGWTRIDEAIKDSQADIQAAWGDCLTKVVEELAK